MNVYNPIFLPPFKDSSNETYDFLTNMDIIFINNSLISKQHSLAVQESLRYHLHIEPYLKIALKNNWIEENIDGYGKIYYKN